MVPSRRVPRRSGVTSTDLAAFAALFAICFPARTAVAHPSLVESSLCGEDAHPKVKRAAHDAPVEDNDISFTMYYAAEQPTDDEMVPDRTIPGSWAINAAEYKPGARHTLVVTIPDPGEFLITASAGIFRELGAHDDGKTNYGAGTGCGGTRYNLREKWSTTLLVWTAPETAETVRFKVTTATGKHGGFRHNAASFVANENLPPPGSTPAGAPPGPPATGLASVDGDEGMNGKFVAHGWFMAAAWAVMIPFGIFSARYARSPPGAPPSRSDAVETVRRGWFKLHVWLNSIGLVSALIGGLLSYSAVEEELGDGMHLRSAHAYWGAATLLLGINQPLNAFTRPPAPGPGEEKSKERRRWEKVHRFLAWAALMLSIVAMDTGTEAAMNVWGAPKGGKAANSAYIAWVWMVLLATCIAEVFRWRERQRLGIPMWGDAEGRTMNRNFVELSEIEGEDEPERAGPR